VPAGVSEVKGERQDVLLTVGARDELLVLLLEGEPGLEVVLLGSSVVAGKYELMLRSDALRYLQSAGDDGDDTRHNVRGVNCQWPWILTGRAGPGTCLLKG
jgi:hypothetical protein